MLAEVLARTGSSTPDAGLAAQIGASAPGYKIVDVFPMGTFLPEVNQHVT